MSSVPTVARTVALYGTMETSRKLHDTNKKYHFLVPPIFTSLTSMSIKLAFVGGSKCLHSHSFANAILQCNHLFIPFPMEISSEKHPTCWFHQI